jgi:hypothetical protein
VKDIEYQKSLEGNTRKVLKISLKDMEYQKNLEDFCEGYQIPKKS